MQEKSINSSIHNILKNNYEKVENMFSSICQTYLKDTVLAEVFPISLLLSYFKNTLNQSDVSQISILQQNDENKILVKTLIDLFTQWNISLEEVKAISHENQLVQYVQKLKQQLSISEQFILPAGFSSIRIKENSVSYVSMLEDEYQGFYPSCIIIENDKDIQCKNIRVLDPIAPYQSSYSTLNIDKINLGINIDNVNLESLSNVFLQQLLSLRVFSSNQPYTFDEFYEVVLSQLKGNSYLKQNESDFLKLDERRFQNLSYSLAKKVLYYLIKQKLEDKQAQKLYNEIILEFEFTILINLFSIYCDKVSQNNLNYDSYYNQQYKNQQNYNQQPSKIVVENIMISLCERISQEATLLVDGIDKSLLNEKILQIQLEISKMQESRFQIQQILSIKFNHENFSQYLSKDLKDLKIYKNMLNNYYYDSYGNSTQAMQIKQITNHFINFKQDVQCIFKQLNLTIDNLIRQSNSIKKTIQISNLIEDFVFHFSHFNFKGWCDNVEKKEALYEIILKAASVYYYYQAIKYQRLFPNKDSEYNPNYFTQFVLVMFSLYAIFQELIKEDEKINLESNSFTGSTQFNQNASLKNVLPDLSIPDQKWLNLLHKVQNYFHTESLNKTPILNQYYNKFSGFESQETNFYIELIKKQGELASKQLEELLNDIDHGEQHKLFKIIYTSSYLPNSFQSYRDISYLARISLLNFEQNPQINYSSNNLLSYNKNEIQLGYQKFNKSSNYNQNSFTNFSLPSLCKKYQQILHPKDYNLQYITENQVIGKQNEKPEEYNRKKFYSQYFIQLNENLKYIYLYTAIQDQQLLLDQIHECILLKQIIHKERNACSNSLQLDSLKDETLSLKLISQLCKISHDLNEKQSQCKLLFYLIEVLVFLNHFVSQKAKQIIKEFFVSVRTQIISRNENKKKDDFEFLGVQGAICILTYKIENHLSEQDFTNILDFRIQIENSFRMNQPLPSTIYYTIMQFILSLKQFFQEIHQDQLKILKKYVSKNQNNQIWEFSEKHLSYKQKTYSYNPIQGRILNDGYPISGLPNFILSSPYFQQFYQGLSILFDYKTTQFLGQKLSSYKSINFKQGKIKIILLRSNDFVIQEKLKGQQQYETLIKQEQMQSLPIYIQKKFSFSKEENNMHDYWYSNNKILVKNRQREIQHVIDLVSNEIFSEKEKLYLIPFTNKFVQGANLFNLFERFESTSFIYSTKAQSKEIDPKQIILYRFGISFLYKNGNLMSNEYKDYQISQSQTLETLLGFKNYLVLEKNQNFMRYKESFKKVLIPHHPIKNIVDFNIETDQKIIEQPPCFMYDVNEELGVLNCQTVSGNIYLALLYYKQGDLSCDKLTKMNSYENCFQILSKAWQNQEYSDLEFNLLLQFFDSNLSQQDNLLEKCISQQTNLKKIFSLEKHGIYTKNINQYTIYLKVMMLLIDSYQIDFMLKANQSKKQIFNFLFENFFNYQFTFYLIYKNKIYSRCLFSETDELKLIENFQSYFTKQKLSQIVQNYQNFLKNTNEIKIKTYKGLDFQTNIIQFYDLQNQFLNIQMTNFQESLYNSFSVGNTSINNFINKWKDCEFSIGLFYKLYQNIIQSQNYDKEQYLFMLQFCFLKNKKNIPEFNLFIKILLSAMQYPMKYKQIEIPSHFQGYTSYQLGFQHQKFYLNDIPPIRLYRCKNFQVNRIKNSVFNFIQNNYLNYSNQIKVTSSYLNDNNTQVQLENAIKKIYQNESADAISYGLYYDIINKLIQNRKNYEISQFFFQLSDCFDNIRFVPEIITRLKYFQFEQQKLNKEIIKREINGFEVYNLQENNLENKWIQNFINYEEIFKKLNDFVEINNQPLQEIEFIFDQLDLSNQSQIILLSGYGQKFIEDLKQSYEIYSQKSHECNSLKEGIKIDDLKEYLIQKQEELKEQCRLLYQSILDNIIQLNDQDESKDNLLLLRICRKQIIPNISEILSIVKNNKSLFEINPQLSLNQAEDIQSKILSYLELNTLMQKIKRVLQLAFDFEDSLKQEKNDEKDRLLEKLIQNMIVQRCYDIKQYPEWLLFEFQNNILIREQQKELALSLFNDKINSIYQLNMGEGKTSVILMLLCQMIADGKQIIRVNCMESLYGIMQDILRNKLSDLLRKKIYILPFSRDIDFTEENILKLEKILQEIREEKGVLLMTPEQRQCFQLKRQELLLEYLETKDADNVFDWKQHNFIINHDKNKFQKSFKKYTLNEHQRILKDVLQSLKYIYHDNTILNYPNDKNEFFEAVSLQYKRNIFSFFKGFNKFVYSAFKIFRMKSTKLKNLLNQRACYFNKISENFTYVDILDESDEILRHGKELNYTLGQSTLLDGGCVRWEIPFLMFRSIFYDEEFISLFKEAYQQTPLPIINNFNYKPKNKIGGGIFLLRFVDEQYFNNTIKPLLAKKIYNIFKEKFDIRTDEIINIQNNTNYGNYIDFIMGNLIHNEINIFNELSKLDQDILNSFLLAKAWLTHNLFFHVMSYRYRVEYGLSEYRYKEVAIPFKAKDLPSEKSEFSHPDIMIGFTILSYLYNGLSKTQFKSAILKLYHDEREDKNEILKSWVQEGQEWIKEYTQHNQIDQPNWLRSFKSFEIEDESKMEIAFICLCRNFKVIKYYLSNFTFPIHAKHYKKRITSNAHSLVSESQTKGFSGTDDKNDSMPETIVPKKLQSQLGTNGKLIHIFSREINQRYFSKSFKDSKQFLDEVSLFIQKENNCFMLIDAGAVITEMNNLDVAKYLMPKISNKFQGIVYFSDSSNKVEVYLSNSQTIPFSTCYIDARQLFIYLDESHTRGSDFMLPITSIGILTVGKDMNKDKFMQAAMRLRDLDFKQSVVVWGSEEISSKIAKLNSIEVKDINTKHVMIWVTCNTIIKNEKDLYPVTLLKFKEQIKNKALHIQKNNISTPIKSLILYIENYVHDEIDRLYSHSPSLQNTQIIIEDISEKIIKDFTSHIENDDLNSQLKNNILADALSLNFEQILSKVQSKLPKQIMTYDVNFDCDEENEQEVEEIQQQEQVVQTNIANPLTEKKWDYNLIFEKDFIKNCHSHKLQYNYPSLVSIRDIFKRSNFQDIQSVKWNNNIYMTQNFLQSVREVEIYQINQNEYFRPIGMILIYLIDDPKIILLSGQEADQIIKILSKKEQQYVCLMHIDDLENPLVTPREFKLIQEEKLNNLFMVLKLLNGQCYFKKEETNTLKLCLGLIQEDSFDTVIDVSNKIYESLKQAQLIQNSQFTPQLLEMLNQNIKTDIICQLEKSFNVDLYRKLRNILNNSIFDQNIKSIDLIKIFSAIADIRGKSNQFAQSTLKNLIQIKLEWYI